MAATQAAHVHVEAIQTSIPTRVVEPGKKRLIAVSAPPLPASALQRRVRAVLYYRADGAPWDEGVWVKESLSEALSDHAEMAGRLRRRADGSWEVKLNDAGVRYQQATVDAAMDEFLADEDRPRKEAALAPWTDVNAEDPDMCAPIFMQLTRFQGDGGYAVGVSCALMLSDPLSLARFLLSWSRTYKKIKEDKIVPHPMMQYMGYFQLPDISFKRISSTPLDSFPADYVHAQTVLFRTRASTAGVDHLVLAGACIDRAADELGKDRASRFTVVVASGEDGDGDQGGTSIETCAVDCLQAGTGGGIGHALEAAQWSELGLEELMIRGVEPVHVSCRILTSGDEGLVVVMPDGDGFLVTATVPK